MGATPGTMPSLLSALALFGALDAPLAPFRVRLVFSETPSLTMLMGGGLLLVAVFGRILWHVRIHSGLAKAAS